MMVPNRNESGKNVAILMQREIQIKAAATIAKTKPTAQSKARAHYRRIPEVISCHTNHAFGSTGSSILRPPWAFLQPLMASA